MFHHSLNADLATRRGPEIERAIASRERLQQIRTTQTMSPSTSRSGQSERMPRSFGVVWRAISRGLSIVVLRRQPVQ